MLVFRAFTSIVSRSLSAITANRALLAYPPVKPVDIILARILLEIMVFFIVWVIFFTLLAATSQQKVIVHADRFAEAVAALILLSTSVGMFNAVMAALSPAWERVWPFVRLPLLFFSGIFYVPILTPPWMQSVLYWNPLLHCVEWLRTATYLTYDPLLDKSGEFGQAARVHQGRGHFPVGGVPANEEDFFRGGHSSFFRTFKRQRVFQPARQLARPALPPTRGRTRQGSVRFLEVAFLKVCCEPVGASRRVFTSTPQK
jgi:hypothetical protein